MEYARSNQQKRRNTAGVSEVNFEKKYLEFLQVHNLCSICLVFVVLTDVFVSQAFERNGRVSVTVMDGEEMVGRMADQVLITPL